MKEGILIMRVNFKFGLACIQDLKALRFGVNPAVRDFNGSVSNKYTVTAFMSSGPTVIRETVVPEMSNKTRIRLKLNYIIDDVNRRFSRTGFSEQDKCTIVVDDNLNYYVNGKLREKDNDNE
jgi:hypothetical protein